MVGQAHICPGKCREDKPMHIPQEINETEYDGTRSCPLRVVDLCTTCVVDPDAPRVKDTGDLFDLV